MLNRLFYASASVLMLSLAQDAHGGAVQFVANGQLSGIGGLYAFEADGTLLFASPNTAGFAPRVVSVAPFGPGAAVQLVSGNTILSSAGQLWQFAETSFRSGIIGWQLILDAPPLAAGSKAAWTTDWVDASGHPGTLIVADQGDMWWWTTAEGTPFHWSLIGNVLNGVTSATRRTWGSLKANYRK